MNLRGGWALIRSTWSSWLQYRSFFFILAFGWMVPPLVAMAVWMAAAAKGGVSGFDHAEFVSYYLVLALVNQITYAQANWTLGDVIREGGLNAWLLRPMPALFNVLASEGAGKVVYLVFVVPVCVVLALLLRLELNVGWGNIVLFLISLVLAWALRFLWGCWLALLAFWSTRADALLALQDSLVFLLAGVVAPVALLPQGLQGIATLLPFRYMISFPVEVLLRPMTVSDFVTGFALQLFWLAVAAGLTRILWQTGLRRYAAVGG